MLSPVTLRLHTDVHADVPSAHVPAHSLVVVVGQFIVPLVGPLLPLVGPLVAFGEYIYHI